MCNKYQMKAHQEKLMYPVGSAFSEYVYYHQHKCYGSQYSCKPEQRCTYIKHEAVIPEIVFGYMLAENRVLQYRNKRIMLVEAPRSSRFIVPPIHVVPIPRDQAYSTSFSNA